MAPRRMDVLHESSRGIEGAGRQRHVHATTTTKNRREVTCRIVVCRSIRFRSFRLELQRGIGIGKVLVRTKAFVDGLENRSATKGVQVFNFDHAIDCGQQFAPRDGDTSNFDEGLRRLRRHSALRSERCVSRSYGIELRSSRLP